jgi:flagellar basal-body rod protein FlgB
MIDRLSAAMDFQSQALKLRAQRQEVLASNIANADTPNYKARDFDFAKALHAATAGAQSANASLATTKPGQVAIGENGAPMAPMLYRLPVQPSIDGNTVDMDSERSLFADNAVRYEAAMRFLNGHIKTMLSAIEGQ